MISHLRKAGEVGYYRLLKQNFVGSRETFSTLLKELEKENIVRRRVLNTRPPRVMYSLTSRGKEVARVLERLDKILRKK